MSQITCIQILKYQSLKNKVWAFGMMQFAHKYFRNVEGLEFYKLMGSGKDFGFNPLPDWSTYALLTVWNNRKAADDFFDNSPLFELYKSRAEIIDTYYLHCIKSHGKWSGNNPFQSVTLSSVQNQIAVLTRATIRKRHLVKFWKYVPQSTSYLKDNPDLLYTKGIGEVPLTQMATFSVWKNLEAIKRFAYKDDSHKKAIQMTRKFNWYKEEMFSRFEVVDFRDLNKP